MADEVHSFQVSIPAGIPAASPVAFNLAMPPRYVDSVQVLVPPGPRGEVGFQIGAAGAQVYPLTPGQFIVTDDELVSWPLEHAISSGAWQLIAYNTGTFTHKVWVRFLVRVPGLSGPNGAAGSSSEPLLPTDLEPPVAVDEGAGGPTPAELPPPPDLQLPELPELPEPPTAAPLPGLPALPSPAAVAGPQALPGSAPGPDPVIDWNAIEGIGQAALEHTVNPPLDPWDLAELNGQGALEGLPPPPPPPPPPAWQYPLLIV